MFLCNSMIKGSLALLGACLPGALQAAMPNAAATPPTQAAPLASAPSASAAAAAPENDWQVADTTTPLTGAHEITATLASTNPVSNMLGHPDQALLVLRCREGVMASYVAWPQVLQVSGTVFMTATPQATVLWKVDDGQIAVNFWVISDSGTATGGFDTKAAIKVVGRLYGAHRLVVRLTGQTTQDAVFELGPIAQIADKVGAACGVKWHPAQ